MDFVKKTVLATTLAASALATASPATARDYYRDYNRRGNDTAAIAVGAGIVGLAIGAIAASNSNRHYRDRYYYDRRYYRDGGDYYRNQYYYRQNPYYNQYRGRDYWGYGYDNGYWGRRGY